METVGEWVEEADPLECIHLLHQLTNIWMEHQQEDQDSRNQHHPMMIISPTRFDVLKTLHYHSHRRTMSIGEA